CGRCEGDVFGELRGDLPGRARDGCRSREQPRFLDERRGTALLEPDAEDTGHGLGTASRRVDGASGLDAGRWRAEADLRRGAEDLRRASAGGVLRGAACLRRHVRAGDQPDARARPAAGVEVCRHGSGPVMARYIARRLLFAALLVFVVSSASLVLTRLAPGDYAMVTLGLDARPEIIEQTRARYGLNRSIAEQYRDWLS